VSSDSDFTGLAVRIREEGLTVFGFGEKKTPEAFRNACHKFVFTEVLRPVPSPTPRPTPAPATAEAPAKRAPRKSRATPAEERVPDGFPREFIIRALEQASDETGWANLAAFGTYLNKLKPDFDARLYGSRKLSELVKSRPEIFRWEERQVPGTDAKVLYVQPANRSADVSGTSTRRRAKSAPHGSAE
jgi:hypothetical protein